MFPPYERFGNFSTLTERMYSEGLDVFTAESPPTVLKVVPVTGATFLGITIDDFFTPLFFPTPNIGGV